MPVPKAVIGRDTGPTKLLLLNQQSRLTPEGDEFYSETASQALSPQGLAVLGNLQQSWDPATETLSVHRLQIIRGDEVIDLLSGGRKLQVLRRESNLDWAMLDGRLTATFQPEGLRVGDVLRVAMSLRRRDPALRGYSTDFIKLRHTGAASRVVLRDIWPTALPMRWRSTEAMKTPVISKVGGMTELIVETSDVEAPTAPLNAPARFGDLGSIEISQDADWAELSGLMSPLYDKASTLRAGSALRDEAAKIAASSTDPKVRALAALRLVEDQVRYVFLGMSDGGLVPADADETWARRFGDCKGKTALLVGLLRALGVDAEPALVDTNGGDGMDARLPSVTWFDHAIVRARIAGKTVWLDATRTGDRGIDSLTIPSFGWALPLRAPGAGLERLAPLPLASPDYESAITVDASQGIGTSAPARVGVSYRGENAIVARASMANMPRADYERGLREVIAKTYPWLDIVKVDITDDAASGVVSWAATGAAKLDWIEASGGAKIYRVPGTAFSGEIAKRQPGPHADAPYAVAYPSYYRGAWRITLPPGAQVSLVGTDVDKILAGAAMKRTARIEGGAVVIELSSRTLAPEFPASEAEASAATFRELSRNDVAVVAAPNALTPASPNAATTLAADRAAAEAGDPRAQFRLALRYAHGDGAPIDLALGSDWLRRSAAKGEVPAELRLAEAYFSGRGVSIDPVEGAVWTRKAADAGSAEGQRVMGVLYENGEGVPRDPMLAISWFEKAAAQGDPPAERLLAQMYFVPTGVARDLPRALDLFRRAAAQNDPDAEYSLGMASLRGEGVPVDIPSYRTWIQKSADQGLPLAEWVVGLDYLNGANGAPRDAAQGLVWLTMSAGHGQVEARGALGFLYLTGQMVAKDTTRGLLLLKGAAEEGYAPAQADLGTAYWRGADISQDDALALRWLQPAAGQRVPLAELNLANMYRSGRAGAVDYPKALALYRQAAEQGLVEAEGYLGDMYLSGQGTAQDAHEAMIWFRKAAEQGNAAALRLVGALYDRGLGVPRDYAEAALWYQKAADKGDADAMSRLGQFYINGLGVAKDPAKAAELLRKPAAAGIADAQANLGFLYDHGFGVRQDFAQAMIWYAKAAAQGHSMGQVNVGVMYHYARGVPRDDVAALAMFRKAADQGNLNGERLVGLAYLNGEGIPVDKAQGFDWLRRAAAQGDGESKRLLEAITQSPDTTPLSR